MNDSQDHTLLLGLDIGGSKCTAVVGDISGRVVDRQQWPSDVQRGPEAMIGDLIGHAQTLIVKYPGVSGVGVPVGGPMDAEAGIIQSPPNLPGWDEIPLKQIFQDKLHLPVTVEHDAVACALAEYHWGAARGQSRVAYLTCGSGFGVGLVFDALPYHGAAGKSIEIGHVRYRDDGPVAFGKQGSFEAFAAGNSLPRLAKWKFPDRWTDQPPTGQQLSKLVADGDEQARQVIDLNAQAVGDACALLGDLLMLDIITLGSLGRYLGDAWLGTVRQQFRDQVLPQVADTCRVEPAGLGDKLQDCSALVVAMQAVP